MLAAAALLISWSIAPVSAGSRAAAATPPPDCHEVKLIAARGSGDNSSKLGLIGTALSNALTKDARTSHVDFVSYGLPYTAVGIATWKPTMPVNYWLSERQGRNMLRAYIKEQARECLSQSLLVVGYSQGAQLVGDIFSKKVGGFTRAEMTFVLAVALIADPRFNSQEKYDRGSFRKGRNGVLGARAPGDLGYTPARAWCRKDDLVCQGPGSTGNHAQASYLSEYKSEIVSYFESVLGWAAAPATMIGGAGVVSVAKGSVGPLRLDISTETDVKAFAGGSPQTGVGTFEAPSTPNFKALGYGCSRQVRPDTIDLTAYKASKIYCQTVYYLNTITGNLSAFYTSSPHFHTPAGTQPTMSQSEASRREHTEPTAGCTSGMSFGNTRASLLIWNRGGELMTGTVNGQPANVIVGGTISHFDLESRQHGIGLLFC